MFRKDGLSRKVSELTLFEIIRGYSDVDDHVGDEVQVTVRVPELWVFVARILKERYVDEYNAELSFSDLYRSAHKLGMMLLIQDPIFSDIRRYSNRVKHLLREFEDDDNVKAMIADSLETAGSISSKFHKAFGSLRSRINFKPYPKWARITYDLSYQTLLSSSDLIRGAILYAFSTEYYLPEIREFRRLLRDYCKVFESVVKELEFYLNKGSQ